MTVLFTQYSVKTKNIKVYSCAKKTRQSPNPIKKFNKPENAGYEKKTSLTNRYCTTAKKVFVNVTNGTG